MLSRRCLLQSIAALLPLTTLGIGRTRNSLPALSEPPEGRGMGGAMSPELARAWGDKMRREAEAPSLFEILSQTAFDPGSGKVVHFDLTGLQ